MSFFAQTGPSSGARLSELLGSAIGGGIGKGIAGRKQRKQEQKQSGILSELLFPQEEEKFKALSPEIQLRASQVMEQKRQHALKQEEQQRKIEKEAEEARIISKFRKGETLTPEEETFLTPTSQRALLKSEEEAFEKESDKLEAKRTAELATEIENDYRTYRDEDMRLGRLESLTDKGELTTPAMMKFVDYIGLPIGVLQNPDTEEYNKIEADYVRDVSKVFPGQIRVYEIQAYMKTVPSLMNSPEGRKRVIENRRIQNEARKVRFDAYKEILKENKGRKPSNLGLLIEEKVGGKLNDLADRYKQGIKTTTPINMIDPNGNLLEVPQDQVERALRAGAKLQ